MMLNSQTAMIVGFTMIAFSTIGLSVTALAGLPGNNSGQPFDEILAQIALLNTKIDSLQETVDINCMSGDTPDLRGIAHNWDKNLPSADRFTILEELHSLVVRDNNTGLLWEQAPDATLRDWSNAVHQCNVRIVDGSVGWRLASVIELKVVQDPSLAPPHMPLSAFSNVQSSGGISGYWSVSTRTELGTQKAAWLVWFSVDAGGGLGSAHIDPPNFMHYACCVRDPLSNPGEF